MALIRPSSSLLASLLLAFAAPAAADPAASAAAGTRPPAPAADCLDARDLRAARRAAADALLVETDAGGWRVELESGCAIDPAESGLSLLAEHGWACGIGAERPTVLRGVERACKVLAVTRLDARAYATQARAADRANLAGGAAVLDAVDVKARGVARRAFAGSTDYCVATRAVRSWSFDGESVLVHTSAMRNGGNRAYRIELAHACPELTFTNTIELHSGIGIGMLCGNPGDALLYSEQDPIRASVASPRAGWRPHGEGQSGMLGLLQPSILVAQSGCAIAAVYPVET